MSTLVSILLGIVASVLSLLSYPFEVSANKANTLDNCNNIEMYQSTCQIINERTVTIQTN